MHLEEMLGAVLKNLTVRDALKDPDHEPAYFIRPKASMREIIEAYGHSDQDVFPVVDEEGRLHGIIDNRRVRHAIAMASDKERDRVVASDLMSSAPLLNINETLYSAMRKIVESKRDQLVVVEDGDRTKIRGAISRRDLVAAYDRAVIKYQGKDREQDLEAHKDDRVLL
ncbi:MAG: CBS domain-containing protein [Myxococcales bacterium]|nr:MAG: CBS domain-containing protein [Myxococcales bacterium]